MATRLDDRLRPLLNARADKALGKSAMGKTDNLSNGVPPKAPLTLGVFEATGQEYIYDSNESLITIARPGRGKTQAHVVRNLLYLEAPAIVLDVKPEIFGLTSAWRGANVGPVQLFKPGDAKATKSFNPLDAIPSDPIEAYTAISRLLPLLMVPTDAKAAKGFWEGRAAQLLHGALYDICLHGYQGRRDMSAVVDWFSPSPQQLKMQITFLQESGVRSLVRVGNQLESADEETRSNLYDTVLRHVEVWGAPQLELVIAETTIDFENFRRDNGTLYLCVTPEELVMYRPLIRTLLGQIFYTIRDASDQWDLPPVTFFLDEFPQLGYMQEVEQMLALGRQSGLRLWLFAQTKAQLQQAYGDADRLLEMMAVRCFMEPTGAMAHELSKELGTVRDLLPGTMKPLATPQQLMGPEYAERVIVLEGGRRPARLYALKAFEDPNLEGRLKE
ncbi:type IV secretory system conjugative DNA transfer family protein [Rhodopseudomonas sp. RCAM05734]|uniref:type IV secretory system conjugative DNA transfer family protein n=1 Tax=Rhodopseudomonas sp. RCAM05734 TaxID=3457549 RepID=UPI004043F9C3